MRATHTLVSLLTLSCATIALACTDFRLISKDNVVMITRTMEYALPLDSHIRSSSQGREFNQMMNNGSGLNWKAKYGYVYFNALSHDFTLDGLNEMGLSFEYLYLPGETEYQKAPAGQEASAIPYLYFGDWVLSNFDNVDQVIDALKSVYIVEYTSTLLENRVYPLHASITDRSGKGIVVEFVGGEVKVHPNMGVMTNSPTYEWQVTNLRNYVSLSPYTPNPLVVNGVSYAATGQGQGMFGLPGDVSPPSRFVKVAAMLKSAVVPENNKELLETATHIINTVDIPYGFVRAKVNGQDQMEFTQWTVFKNLGENTIYYRSYEDSTLRSVALKDIAFAPGSTSINIPLSTQQMIVDMSGPTKAQ